MYRPGQPNWEFCNFPATLILREIKTATFTIIEVLNVEFLTFSIEEIPKNQTSMPPKLLEFQFLTV